MRTSRWRSPGSQEPVTRFWGWGDARNAYPSRDVVASRSRSRSPASSSGSWSTWACTASNVPNPHLTDELGPQGTSALPTCETTLRGVLLSDELWVADIAYVRTFCGWANVALLPVGACARLSGFRGDLLSASPRLSALKLPCTRLFEVRAHPVARTLAGSIDDARGRLR